MSFNLQKNFDTKFKNVLIVLSSMILFLTVIKIIYMVQNILSFSIPNNSYNEVRDYAGFRLTQLLMNGTNPYTLDTITKANVPFMFLYTSLQPIFVAFICKITGLSIIAANYLTNLLLFLITSLNIWLIIRDCFHQYKFLGISCLFINVSTFFSLLGLPIFNFHADTVGICLTSLIFLTVYKWREKTFLVSIMSIFLIFTKQILIVLALPIFIYYYIINKKLAVKYLLQCIICGFITIFIVQIMFPLYWTETIYAQFYASKDYGSFTFSILNICYFYYRYSMYVLLIVLSFLGIFRYDSKQKVIEKYSSKKHSYLLFIYEFIKNKQYVAYLMLNMIIGTISLLYFAKCGGDGYKYCQDILAPSFFILTIYIWHDLGLIKLIRLSYRSKELDEKYITKIVKSEMKYAISLLALCVISVITYANFDLIRYTKSDRQAYQKFKEIISLHHGENIYLGINSTQYLLNNEVLCDETIYFNDGQLSYFTKIPYNDNEIMHHLFYGDVLKKAAEDYVVKVNDMIKEQKFSLVTTCMDKIIDEDILKDKYYMYDKYSIKTDANINYNTFEVTVWLPKHNPNL